MFFVATTDMMHADINTDMKQKTALDFSPTGLAKNFLSKMFKSIVTSVALFLAVGRRHFRLTSMHPGNMNVVSLLCPVEPLQNEVESVVLGTRQPRERCELGTLVHNMWGCFARNCHQESGSCRLA